MTIEYCSDQRLAPFSLEFVAMGTETTRDPECCLHALKLVDDESFWDCEDAVVPNSNVTEYLETTIAAGGF